RGVVRVTQHRRIGAGGNQSPFFFGRFLRLVEASSSSSPSLIDLYMLFEAPFSSFTLVSPRLAESAAPAAFCWASDLAGMGIAPVAVRVGAPERPLLPAGSRRRQRAGRAGRGEIAAQDQVLEARGGTLGGVAGIEAKLRVRGNDETGRHRPAGAALAFGVQ